MPRFFVTDGIQTDKPLILTGDSASHAHVLRLRIGDEICVCDGQGQDYMGTICEMNSRSLTVQITSSQLCPGEPTLQCSVYMAFPKADKLEHVIQKATELGAYEIVTFPTARSVSRPDASSLIKKQERWQKIAQSASEQSQRGRIPQVVVLSSFQDALQRASHSDISILLYENEKQHSLRSVLTASSFRTISLFSGPEGGLTPEEVQWAQEAGLHICSLGPRILRCETAPLCSLSAVLYASGQLE